MTIYQRPNKPAVIAGIGFLISLTPVKPLILLGIGVLLISGTIWSYGEITSGVNWFRRVIGAIGLVVIGAYIYVRFAFIK